MSGIIFNLILVLTAVRQTRYCLSMTALEAARTDCCRYGQTRLFRVNELRQQRFLVEAGVEALKDRAAESDVGKAGTRPQ